MIHPLGFALLATLTQPARADRSLPELRQVYAQQCARCHGPDGSGTSPEGTRLKGLDFTSARDMNGRTDEGLAKAIAAGLFFGIRMPAFGAALSEGEIRTLVREILRKAEKGRDIGASPAAQR